MAAPTKVITGTRTRLSYVHLFEPYANENQEPKYSCVIMVPKTDKATIKALRAAQQAALEAGAARHFGGKIPRTWHDTIKDGDDEEVLEKNPEYAGYWVFSVSSKAKPGIVDGDVQPILDASEVYSGIYARVSINAFSYNTQGNKGVSFGLNHVQKVADGEPFGNITRADDDFDALDDEDDEDDGLI